MKRTIDSVRKSVFLLFLLFSLILSSCAPSWDTIAQQRDGYVTQMSALKASDTKADQEIDARSWQFPTVYSQTPLSLQTSADQALANIGSEDAGWIKDLDNAIKDKKRKDAQTKLEQIQGAVDVINNYTQTVLGGYYDSLLAEEILVDTGYVGDDNLDLFGEVRALQPTVTVSIAQAEKFYLCSTTTQMGYSSAWADYGNGMSSLTDADHLLAEESWVLYPDGHKAVDKIAVSRKLASAWSKFKNAIGETTGQKKLMEAAQTAIGNAESAKKQADEDRSWHLWADYQEESDDAYREGNRQLNQAKEQCLDENFDSSQSTALSAQKSYELSSRKIKEEKSEPIVITVPDTPNTDNSSTDWISSSGIDTSPSISNDSSIDLSNDGGIDLSSDGGIDISNDGGL